MDLVYIKNNVSLHEYIMHKHVYDLNIVNTPEILMYNQTDKILIMKKIDQLCISDMYGEEPEDVEEYLFDEIRKIIKKLADSSIEYPDITGYNFIEKDGKVWIIDFEHSKINRNIKDPFINKFIDGLNKWNPEFR